MAGNDLRAACRPHARRCPAPAKPYGEPYPITRALIEDGRTRLLLHAPIVLDCPVRLLHGQEDPDVPWELALRIAEHVTSAMFR